MRPSENPSPQDVNAFLARFNEARYAEAANLAEAMTRRHPRHPFGWKAWGEALRQSGRNEEALKPVQEAVGLGPKDAEVHNILGIILSNLGRLEEAVASYQRAVELKPDFAEAHSNLGNALTNLGQLAEAAASYRRAVEFKPDFVQAHNNLGNVLAALGQCAEAAASYRRVLAIKPDCAEVHNDLGNVLKDLGQLAEAVTSYRRALELNPDFAGAHSNLGNGLKELGRFAEAAASYRRALELKPDFVGAHNNLGNVLAGLGQPAEAAASYRRALELKPDFVQAHNNLGNVLTALGQPAEAAASYRRALELKPDYAEAHNNLGAALKDLGQLAEAVTSYRRALVIKPDYADAHSNLGNVLTALGQFDEAVASHRRALELKPASAETHNNLGNVLTIVGHLDEAVTHYRQALELKPELADAHGNLGMALQELGRLEEAVASYRRALELKRDFALAHSNLVMALHYQVGNEAEAVAAEHRRWSRQHAVAPASFILPHANDRSPGRRLRIGYVSPDFRDHVVGYNVLPLFKRHNHQAFEIFGYAQVARPDEVTRQFQACCDHWRQIGPLTDAQLADQVRHDQIDILVDLALHTANNRLPAFARKPAPVQVSFAGYPGGTGLDAIDWHLTDSLLEPSHANNARGPDALFPLPASFWCYEGLAIDLPVGPLPALATGQVTFGCLNNFRKVTEHMLQLWAEVMRRVLGSHILLFAPKGGARERTLGLFGQAGIAADRIEFADRQSREGYLALYGRVDLGLDTFPYNGHTTSLDSYWMGVPIVTLVGSTPVSRGGWSQLSNLGLTELAAETAEGYVRVAANLACDLPRLAALRAGLRERMRSSPLMDGDQFVRGVESAYRTMWHRWCDQSQVGVAKRRPLGAAPLSP